MRIQQLFCKHIYKLEEETFLRLEREPVKFNRITFHCLYAHYLKKYECVKCGKILLKETRKQII